MKLLHFSRFCRLLLVLLWLVVIVSCNKMQPQSIRFGLATAPVTLDPRYATDAVSHRINRLLYRRLVDFDENYHMQPQLADWQQLSSLHYRFHLLNKGRTFHNGQRLEADDVMATYDYVLDPANASPHRATLTNIDRIEAIDADTLDVYIHEPDTLFPGRMVIGIVPASLIRAHHSFNEDPVGSGPLRFQQWKSDDHLVLERRDDGRLFEFITVKDATVRVLKLVRGELDLVQGDLPFELLDWLREQPGITVESRQGNVFTYIGFNLRDPVLSRLPIRQAIAFAIDREAIIRHVLGNAARKAGALLTPDHWAGHPRLTGYPYDPARAARLLAGEGYDHQHPLQLSYKTSNNALRLRLATIIQYQLQRVGIDVDLGSYDWGTFYADIKAGRFQMYSLSWVGLNMPDIFRYVFHSESLPPAGANRGYFADAATDRLIEQAENLTDLDRQAAVYHALQERLLEQLPYVPLWYEDNLLARRNDIQGYRLSVNGDYDGLIDVERRNP